MINQKHLSLAVTLRCNLKCELCSAASPYYHLPTIYSSDILGRSVDEYFKIVKHVEKFTITGGEPLLSNVLPHIIKHLKTYLPQIGKAEIITNGTIIPNQDVIEALIDTKDIVFLIDNYGSSVSHNVEELKETFKYNGIRYSENIYYGEETHYGGWVDFRDLTLRTIHPSVTFSKCAYPQKMGFCYTMIGGRIFPCSATRRCVEQGIISLNDAETLDIFDENLSYDQKVKWFTEMEKVNYLKACSYCPGLSADAKRFPPGMQIENPIKSKYIW